MSTAKSQKDKKRLNSDWNKILNSKDQEGETKKKRGRKGGPKGKKTSPSPSASPEVTQDSSKRGKKKKESLIEEKSTSKDDYSKTFGRRRRYIAHYVGASFEKWEQQAKEKGLLGPGLVLEVLYAKDQKKSKEIYLRQERQAEGVVEGYEGTLLKNVRPWEGAEAQHDMAKLHREKKNWRENFNHKFYPEYRTKLNKDEKLAMLEDKLSRLQAKQERKAQEKLFKKKKDTSDSDDEESLANGEDDEEDSILKPSRKSSISTSKRMEVEKEEKDPPLFSEDDMFYNLQLGMSVARLVRKINLLHHPPTLRLLNSVKRGLEEVAATLAEQENGEDEEEPDELVHYMPPPPAKRKPNAETDEVAKELELEDKANGNEKKIKNAQAAAASRKASEATTVKQNSSKAPDDESNPSASPHSKSPLVGGLSSPVYNKRFDIADNNPEFTQQVVEGWTRRVLEDDDDYPFRLDSATSKQFAEDNAELIKQKVEEAKKVLRADDKRKRLEKLAKNFNILFYLKYIEVAYNIILPQLYYQRGYCEDTQESEFFYLILPYLEKEVEEKTK